MKRMWTWVSGASLIALFACASVILLRSATSRPPPAYFISLPGVVLLCVDGTLGPGWRMFSCSTVGGSPEAGDAPATMPSSGPTLRMLSVVDV